MNVQDEFEMLIAGGMTRQQALTKVLQRYRPEERSRILRTLTAPKVTIDIPKKNVYNESSPYYGCQTDDDGYTLDYLTQQTIPEDKLISYVDGDRRWCFNIDS